MILTLDGLNLLENLLGVDLAVLLSNFDLVCTVSKVAAVHENAVNVFVWDSTSNVGAGIKLRHSKSILGLNL